VVAGARRRMALVETRLCHFYFEGVREPTEPRRHEMQLSGFFIVIPYPALFTTVLALGSGAFARAATP